VQKDQYAEDLALTLRNRAMLTANQNLLQWYRQLYRAQFAAFPHPEQLRILEIGSGVSPLKRFYKNVLTSDVLELDYLDYVFDCHSIDQVAEIPDSSLDVITLTNVLHHLKDPVEFLNRAAGKLKQGGKIIATEPYLSKLSTLIYKYLHHETVDIDIPRPVLDEIQGPLTTSNSALPWLIFVKHPAWREGLRAAFDFDEKNFEPFSSISYMATGGISRRLPIPRPLYHLLLPVDILLSRAFPRLLASFFIITLTRK
jgi:SAM-dependent methyltransferase